MVRGLAPRRLAGGPFEGPPPGAFPLSAAVGATGKAVPMKSMGIPDEILKACYLSKDPPKRLHKLCRELLDEKKMQHVKYLEEKIVKLRCCILMAQFQ